MSTDKVRVAVRVRPMNRRETDMATKCVVDMEDNQTVLYHHGNSSHDGSSGGGKRSPKTFAFDNCFWSMDENNQKFASQEKVFNCLGKEVLERAFEGYNGCIFAYGQTGSGKSYTMMGSLKDSDKGIIPRLCDLLFEKIAHNDDDTISMKVEVSYMEIYNEKVHDLLDPKGSKQNLKVREHNILGPYVDGLSMLVVASFEDIDNLMNEGNKSRTVAATNMNNESSRSHAVFNIVLTQTLTDPSSGVSGEKVSKLSLVDLAGSERAQKTGAVGDRLKEGSNINKSLTTLGLVISALADQSGHKNKNKFVPYRDSVLTWLLKDNLGGNSKTVMVATISPAADNYEETLSTLRYADRAKRIVNHAVINEDPNARIIRDLRDEVDVLKKQLNEAQSMKAPELNDRLQESEKLIKEMTKTWEEKLQETERIHQERHEALEKMGVSVQTSGIKVETGKHYLVNLNADPSLNELLVYYLKEQTLVGRPDAPTQQDIQLSGLGIMPEHSVVNVVDNNEVFVTPLDGAKTCINGSVIRQKTKVKHGDRILWGNNHFFRINCPKLNSPQTNEPEQPIDYNFAQQELMMKEYSNDPIQEAIGAIEKQYEEDKQEALEKQRQMYERQMQMLRSQIMSPGTPSVAFSPLNFTAFTPTGSMSSQSSIQRKYQQWAQDRDKSFKQSLVKLREEVIKANTLVREANDLAIEMGKLTEFQVTLQIPASNLSPNRRRGAFVSEPAILVKRKGRASQIWSMEKFENKIIDMRDMYEERKNHGIPMRVEEANADLDLDLDTESWDEGPPVKGDPFYESHDNHNLIGVANIFLDCLFHDVKLDYQVPIISQHGEVAGKLHVEISKLGGTFLDRYADTNADVDEEDSIVSPRGSPMIVRVCIHEAKGLPPALSNFVFCQYNFWGCEEAVVAPPEIHPESANHNKSDSIAFKFKHRKDFKVSITEEFIEHCSDGALSIEVWGHRSQGFGLINPELDNVNLRSRTLSDRWSEVMRKIELWVEIHELNHQGEYSAVEVQPKPEVKCAGVLQLQQGHSRRVLVRVKTVANSGTLPLICESITSLSIGCICARNKLQKSLDSYQEEDLVHLRERWNDALERRKEYLNGQIQKLINKQDKSEADADRERALMDQWVSLTEERNAVMVPSPGSGIPGAPADIEMPPDMEEYRPVLFLDLNADDMSAPNVKEGFQAAGVNSILPKERSSPFVNLPIIKSYLEKDSVCCLAAWDSSLHDSTHLNRVTPSAERVYLILKAVVRLSHPASMELVLRKRICINIYNTFSITSFTDKLRKKITGGEHHFASGITYDVVSNIPKASEDLENMETLAQMAASQNEINAADGETYIEKYIKGISAVESILTIDRLRQEVAVKELSAVQGRSLRKTTSVPNISQNVTSPVKMDSQFRADSIQDLSHDFLSPGRPGSLPATPKSMLSPMGSKMAVKPMRTLIEEQHHRETKPLLRTDTEEELDEEDLNAAHKSYQQQDHSQTVVEDDPSSVGSDDFQDFESYQSQQESHSEKNDNTAPDCITHSSTNDSLAEAQAKNFTPSLVSSGYGSQAVSMLTLSSEDSLSIRSIEENGDKEGRGVQKGSVEQVSSGESDFEEQNNVSGDLKMEDDTDQFDKSSMDGGTDSDASVRKNTEQISNSLSDISPKTKEVLSKSSSEDSYSEIHKQSSFESSGQGFNSMMDQSKAIGAKEGDGLWNSKNNGASSVSGSNSSKGACAITKEFDGVDPYSETAMAELEKLAFDEEEETDFNDDKSNNIELFIREDNDDDSDVKLQTKISNTKNVEKRQGVKSRPRPQSCIVTSPHSDVTASILEESMKRNSLVLDTSDDHLSGGEDSLSVCSFGSRADLDRLQEVPVPSWVQIGESVIVNSSKGGSKTGVVQFVGNVEFANGPWVGVELDLPEGKNDGSVNGIRYFKCRSRHGVFVRHDKLILDKKRRGSRKRAKDSVKRHSIGYLSGSNPNLSTSRSPGSITSPTGGSNSSFMKPTSSSSAKKK